MNILVKVGQAVQKLASEQDACLVSFSGGKDSLAILHIARRHFKYVVGFFLYFVPGLRHDVERLKIAKDWGIEVLEYPDKAGIENLRRGIYCFRDQANRTLPEWGQPDYYAAVRHDTGIKYILTGMKKSDSMARKRMLTKFTSKDVYHPFIDMANFDVLAYCRINGIALPLSRQGARSSGVDLYSESLLFMHKNYPDDFEKICRWFPLARAVIYREKWYWGYDDGDGKTAGA